ncbi:Doublecortin domain-containing protein 2, partial [Frankliniella fusca]
MLNCSKVSVVPQSVAHKNHDRWPKPAYSIRLLAVAGCGSRVSIAPVQAQHVKHTRAADRPAPPPPCRAILPQSGGSPEVPESQADARALALPLRERQYLCSAPGRPYSSRACARPTRGSDMTRGRSSFTVTKLMSPEVGKWVTVNVNGNMHHMAKILISPYTMRQFENLLSHLTEKLKPPFGAVWRIFTEDGVEIRDLEDIVGGQTYIASGRAKPMFPPVRTKGRGRRESARPGRERELRSHSAVGSLGGGGSGGGGGGGETRRGSGSTSAHAAHHVLDAASDTNVKQKHA